MFFLAPFRAPELVAAHNSSSRTLVVKWSKLQKQYFRGKPIGYQIVYYPADAESERYSMRVKDTINNVTLTNLTVYTLYVIHVSAVSSGGIGPENTVNARTDAAGI